VLKDPGPSTYAGEVSTSPGGQTHLRRAVVLTTASSVLVPVAGLLTQPILARTLGAEGRGELAAALAPAVLLSSVATLGLPDALTYLAARRPRSTWAAIGWSSLLSTGMGLLCVLVTLLAAPSLSGGDPELPSLIVLSMVLWIPLLVIGSLRGAARGHQAWTASALESVLNTALRVASFLTLWIVGELNVVTALLVTALAQTVAGFAYLPLLRRLARRRAAGGGEPTSGVETEDTRSGVLRPLLRYGGRVWFGSIAGMLVARTGQILMVPLSSTQDLGLYTVAVTVSDLPIFVAMSVAGALQGVNSRSNDSQQVAAATRLTLLMALLGCGALAALTPFGVPALFGTEFDGAVVPTLMLLFSAVLCAPGFMASAGLAASGRPGLRSWGFVCTFLVNVGAFVLLVPLFGVVGACWASIASNAVQSGFMVIAASRVMKEPVQSFVQIRRSDVTTAWREGSGLLLRVVRR
jgi:O-antigen/teichoic acid export membrane protein